jgi:hypothetical protein
MMNRHVLAAALLLATAAFMPAAADADAASQAIDSARAGDYATALNLLQPEVARGDAHAEFVLVVLYASGLGVAKDTARAADLIVSRQSRACRPRKTISPRCTPTVTASTRTSTRP